MSALTSLLVRDEVVSVQQIEDALQRQVLEGGELDTALLELDAARENVLNAYRAASYGLLAASRDELMNVASDALARVPADLARRHRIVPLAYRDGLLHLASAQPFEPTEARAIEEALRAPIVWFAATEVRVEAALAQHYGLEIAPRMRRLAEQVAAKPAGELLEVEPMMFTPPPPSLANELFDVDDADGDADDTDTAGGTGAIALPPPTIVTEHGAGARAVPQAKPVEVARVVAVSAAGGGDSVREQRARDAAAIANVAVPAAARVPRELSGRTPARGTPRPRIMRFSLVPKGPLSADKARLLLENANERDEIVDVFFSYARQYFESTALFAVREDRAIGLESYNTPQVGDVHELSILFEPGGTLEEITRTPSTRVVDLSRKDADQALALALGRMHEQPCALIPVCIRQRVVSLVYGDRAGQRFRVDDVAELIELLPSVSQAFERIIRNRKLFAMQSRRAPKPSSASPRAAWSTPPAVPAHAPAKAVPPPSAARSHEVAPPLERKRKSGAPTPTLAGLVADKRTPTARDMTSAPSSLPPPDPRAARKPRVDMPFARPARDAREALSLLGVPRSAPPPPAPSAREVLEQQPTMTLPVQPGGASESAGTDRLSKSPPGTGAYSPRDEGQGDDEDAAKVETRPGRRSGTPGRFAGAEPPSRGGRPSFQPLSPGTMPDPNEPPEPPRPRLSRPPARSSKAPPGTGSYQMSGGDSELVSLPPETPPEPAGRASRTPPKYNEYSEYSESNRPPEVVSMPTTPRAPARFTSAAPAQPPLQRQSRAPITQPLGPKRISKSPQPADQRRGQTDDAVSGTEVVRMSKAVRDSLRPPAPAASTPSIIVDTSSQLSQLVSDLCRSGPDDEDRIVQTLLRSGDAALPILARHFPGPLWFDRRHAHPRLPLGRDVSAIARALSAFGGRAWPYLAELLCERDADTRFYATLLVSDRVQPELLGALCDRLFDTDPQIRLIVKDVLPQYRDIQSFSEILQTLRERARNRGVSIIDRLAALDALAVLRDVGSVPLLVRLNEDTDKQISLPAHRALAAITGQDFGTSTRKWQAWFDDNGRRHRVEWLIQSLMHADQPLRASAGIELQKLTQVYYGYVASAPKRERERAQHRYQEWWDGEGRKRFSRS